MFENSRTILPRLPILGRGLNSLAQLFERRRSCEDQSLMTYVELPSLPRRQINQAQIKTRLTEAETLLKIIPTLKDLSNSILRIEPIDEKTYKQKKSLDIAGQPGFLIIPAEKMPGQKPQYQVMIKQDAVTSFESALLLTAAGFSAVQVEEGRSRELRLDFNDQLKSNLTSLLETVEAERSRPIEEQTSLNSFRDELRAKKISPSFSWPQCKPVIDNYAKDPASYLNRLLRE